nr:putative zinc finger, CCHC-type [Tanacetum cinerariifolium]
MSTNVAASNSKAHAAEAQATGINKSSQPSSLLFLDQLDVDVSGPIVVMIGRMWDVSALTRRYLSTDCVVSDSKEGGIYSIKNFAVHHNKNDFRIVKHDTFMLEFDGSTTIRKTHASDVGFLRYPFQLVAYDHIEPTNNKYMIDVTGYVTNVGRTTYLITDYQKGASSPHKPAKKGIPYNPEIGKKPTNECIKGNMTKGNKKGATRSTRLLELIHTDICGPSPSGIGGHKSFITFIDDDSRYMYLFIINEKSESLKMFKTFKAEVENQLDRKIKVVRSDRGGEYYGRHTDVGQALGSFFDFCKDHGIINQYTMPGTPQQNGVAERRNHTLMDMGCPAEAKFYNPQSRKLDLKPLVAFSSGTQNDKELPIYCSSHSTRIVKTRHAEVFENANNSGSDHPNNVEENEPNPEINVEPQETQQPLHKSQRNRQPTNLDDYYTYLNEADFDLGKCNDPESFEDAITCDQSAH